MLFIFLLLCSLTSCKTAKVASVSLSVIKNQGLDLLTDSLYFKSSDATKVDIESEKDILAGIFKSEGFDIKKDESSATVIATFDIEEKTYVGRKYDTVVDSTGQWIYNPATRNMENKPVYNYRKVERDFTYLVVKLKVLFEREGKTIVEATMEVVKEDYDQDPEAYLQKLFELIKDGRSLKQTDVKWYDEDTSTKMKRIRR